MPGKTSRRTFLMGCSASIAAMSGSRLNQLVFGGMGNAPQNALVYVFLRGGIDGLSLCPVVDGRDRGAYEAARPRLQIPAAGEDAALALDGQFGLHPRATPLQELYLDGKLAIVQATGLSIATRSHFDAMEYIELGTPGSTSGSNGWLSRHLSSVSSGSLLSSAAIGSLQPTSLSGDRETLVLDDAGSFRLDTTAFLWRDPQRLALRQLYESGDTVVHHSGVQALETVDVIDAFVTDEYEPANGATYPRGQFGEQLSLIAQLIKLDMGLSVATIDLGGWDTHENQGNQQTGYFGNLVGQLAEGLAALYTDVDSGGASNLGDRLTIVVQSEFGRRLRENANRGTDHGRGNPMLVLGGEVNGGFYGQWPGLAADQLFDGADLEVTTDFRQVLSEILIRRLANPRRGEVFPGYTDYFPLGIVQGEDLLPDFTNGGTTGTPSSGGILLK